MGSLVFFVLKVCLFIGVVASSENKERSDSDILFPDEDFSQLMKEKMQKLVDSTEKSESDSIPKLEVPESINNRNIIEAPPKACSEPCHRRDPRQICRKIVGCKE